MKWIDELKSFWNGYNHALVNGSDVHLSDEKEKQAFERKKQQLKERKAQIVKAVSNAQIVGCHYVDHKEEVRYGIHHMYLIRQKNNFYIEESVEERKAVYAKGKLIGGNSILSDGNTGEKTKITSEAEKDARDLRFSYNRLQAVKYAERWWNSYNPGYRRFDVDCTNYVSQCLHAGGAPMRGYPNRSKGWWYQNNNWSYSWSVAHALRWYLSSSQTGLKAKEMTNPSQLAPGDVICYDFDGDGRWQHNTIVVAKDKNNMPLVNAHTTNSRMRYWAYEDSTAWTPKIQYKFFHIIDDHR